jgi:hypothetical protein
MYFPGFLEERALPSAGSLNFLQSLICTFENNCYNAPPSANRLSEELELDKLVAIDICRNCILLIYKNGSIKKIFSNSVSGLIRDLTNISKRRITDEEVAKGSGVAIDVAAGVAFAFKIISSGSIPKISFPLKNIVSHDAFQRLVRSKNATQTSALFESIVHIPSSVISGKYDFFQIDF